MRIITIILFSICFKLQGQQFPVVIDTVQAEDEIKAEKMLEGGFELISISNNYQEFKISNIEQLNNEHDYRRYKYVEKYGESNSLNIPNIEYEDSVSEIPVTVQPPPPPPVPDPQKTYTMGKDLKVIVNVNQIVAISDYTDNSKIMDYGGETVGDIYESEINFLSKYYKPSDHMVQGYPVMIQNISDSLKSIETQEGWIYMIQEAIDPDGQWKPIEYIDYSVVCGASRGASKLIPGEYLISKIYKYSGNFKTKLRIRFSTHKEVYFSNEFVGSIDLSQFEIPAHLPEQTDNINEHFLKN